MLVIAVGSRSRYGKLRASLTAESTDTPLQEKLDTLAGQIGNGGMIAAGATFIAMLVVWYYSPDDINKPSLFEYTLKAFIMAVTIVVVAVPEGKYMFVCVYVRMYLPSLPPPTSSLFIKFVTNMCAKIICIHTYKC